MWMPKAYRSLGKSVGRYWADYGGSVELLKSPFVHFSVLVTALSYKRWLHTDWTDLPIALLPNLLGFSLGAYALIFTLANERLLVALSAPVPKGKITILRMINATYLHFILIQTAAIVFAIINKSSVLVDLIRMMPIAQFFIDNTTQMLSTTAGAIGYFLTVYAVVLLVGAALATYRLAIMSGKAAFDGSKSASAPFDSNSS